ncbi:MAG: hypothetical protein Hals2KO_30390 [Halioglobus sp.]
MKGRSLYRTRQTGVAIAVVMWFVAGMAILVAGIVMDARMDTRMAQVHLGRAKAAAAGDGAIALALLEVRTRASERESGPPDDPIYRLGDTVVQVQLQPQSGLINLNLAPRSLLAALFQVKGGLDEPAAAELAGIVVEWRSSRDGAQRRPGASGFRTPEDLLRVRGFSRTLLDAIRDYVVVGSGSSAGGAVNWVLAPEPLLAVAQQAVPDSLASILDRRAQQRLAASAGKYRVDALVRYGDRVWQRRQWVTMGSAQGGRRGSSLPWQVERMEQARIYTGYSDKS